MKRPGVVWVYAIIIVLGALLSLLSIVLNIRAADSITAGTIIGILIVTAVIILRLIMIVYFFNLKKKAVLWAHISFGAALAIDLLKTLLFVAGAGLALGAPASLLSVGFYIFFWWAVVDYVNKKEIDGKKIFT